MKTYNTRPAFTHSGGRLTRWLKNVAAAFLAAALTVTTSQAAPPLPILVETATIPAGGVVNYITLSPDGTQLYAASRNATTNQITLLIISTATNTVTSSVPLGVGVPMQIAFTPNGARAYIAISQAAFSVVTAGTTRVAVVDTATRTLVTSIPFGAIYGNIGVAVNPSGTLVYVTDRGESDVYIVSTATNTQAGFIDLANVHNNDDITSLAIAITPDGSRAYVVNRATSNVTLIRLSDNAVLQRIPLSLAQSFFFDSISITPDGKRAYITYSSDSRVSVLDTNPASPTYNTEIAVLPTSGAALREIQVRADGGYAFIASGGTDQVLILDTDPASATYNQQIDSIGIGHNPAGVAVHPSKPLAYVANAGENDISVIAPASPRRIKTDALAELQSLRPTGDKQVDNKLCEAINAVTRSLKPELWVTDYTLAKNGEEVFEQEKNAVNHLAYIVKGNGATASHALSILLDLVEVDRALAQFQLDAAIAGGGVAKYIAQAQKELTDGNADVATGSYEKGIEHFKKAWQAARKALGL
jgi:YVTN family beta-propeller protein